MNKILILIYLFFSPCAHAECRASFLENCIKVFPTNVKKSSFTNSCAMDVIDQNTYQRWHLSFDICPSISDESYYNINLSCDENLIDIFFRTGGDSLDSEVCHLKILSE